MQTSDKTLKEVLDALIERQFIPQSRLGPIRTAITQYAIILGYPEPAECPMTAYHLSDETRNRLIEERAQGTKRGKFASSRLGPHAIRNLKNNVSYVIRSAMDRGVIGQVPGPLSSYKDCNRITHRLNSRHECVKPSKYILDPLPQGLAQEISDYEEWSTKIVNRDRPDNLRKRAVSFANHRGTILRAAGYLVKYRGVQPESFTLSTLTEPENALNFIDWFIEQQRRFTLSAHQNLAQLIVLAKYLSIVNRSTQKRSDDWKPFEFKTLDQMLNARGRTFKSQTKLIAALDEDFANINTVLEAGIVIYFIDVFALFLQRYKDLAIRLDGALANSEKCCFVSTFGLSDGYRGLMAASRKSWPAVFDNYMEGKLHRIALGPDDVINLRNYWIGRLPKEINPALEQELSQLLGSNHPTEVPRNQPT